MTDPDLAAAIALYLRAVAEINAACAAYDWPRAHAWEALLGDLKRLWPQVARQALSHVGGAVDHIDRNPRNNDPANLRVVDIKENRKGK